MLLFFPTNDSLASSSSEKKPRKKRLTADDFRSGKISEAVFLDACTRFFTIFPLAAAGNGVWWTLLIARSWESLLITAALAVLGVGNFVYHFAYKGEAHAVERVDALRAQMRQEKLDDFAEVAEQCALVKFDDGAQKVQELRSAFIGLVEFLKTKVNEVDITHWLILADDTFQQAAAYITHALEVYQAIASVNEGKLQSEMAGFQKELLNPKLQTDGVRAQQLKDSIADHTKRLAQLDKKKEQLQQLLSNVGTIIDALSESRVSMVDLGHTTTAVALSENGGAYELLKASVQATVKVEARLRGELSDEEVAMNKEYLRAADGAKAVL